MEIVARGTLEKSWKLLTGSKENKEQSVNDNRIVSICSQLRCYFLCLLFMFFSTFTNAKTVFPVPDSFDIVIVSDSLDFNGFDMQSTGFSTKDTEADIEEFYIGKWGVNGIKNSVIPGWRIISHVENGLLYTVQIPRNEKEKLNGSVMHGYLGISNLPSIKKLSRKLGKGFPMLSGTTVLNDILQNDGGKEARTLWMVNEKSVEQNTRHVREFYKNKGWNLFSEESLKQNSSAMMMDKSGAKLDMSVQKIGKYTHILAVVSE